jgi:hypothetical protein
MWDMFGLGLKSQAQGEIDNLTDDRSKLENWDLGDRFRSFVTGTSREETQKKAQELLEQQINKLSKQTQGTITESLAGTKIDVGNLNIQAGETQEEYDTRLSGLKNRGAANLRNLGIEGYDPSKVTAGMGTSEIMRLGTTQQTTNKEAEETKQTTEIRRQEERRDSKEADAKVEAAQIRADDRAAQREDNKLTRDLSILSGDREMAIAQMNADLADKRMDYDRETRRMDKRSQAIAQLMSGLGSLGGAFSL